MKITSIKSYSYQNNVKFTGKKGLTYTEEVVDARENSSFRMGLGAGVFLSSMIAIGVSGGVFAHNEQENQKFIDKIETIYNSNNIKKDTFMVRDINNDNYPDLILYRNDGSKVIVDFADRKIKNL